MSRLHDPKNIEYVKAHYADTCTKQIAKKLNLRISQVYNIAFRFGLTKSESYHEKGLSGRINKGEHIGKSHQFKKGHIPFNKGKKWKATGRAIETQFKKGHEPHNTKYDGHERISKDGYVEIRVSKGVYKLKHRVVWESVNGAVPKGMCLVFKDKNKQNISIENLEIITRKENMLRNTIHRYSEELKPIVKLIGKLKNKAHEKSNRRPKKSPVCAA